MDEDRAAEWKGMNLELSGIYDEHSAVFTLHDSVYRTLFGKWGLDPISMEDEKSFSVMFNAKLEEAKTEFQQKEARFFEGFVFPRDPTSITADDRMKARESELYKRQLGNEASVLAVVNDYLFEGYIDEFLGQYRLIFERQNELKELVNQYNKYRMTDQLANARVIRDKIVAFDSSARQQRESYTRRIESIQQKVIQDV
jgi:hypothetical protein